MKIINYSKMEDKTEKNEMARDSGFQNPESQTETDLTTSIPPIGAGNIFNQSRGNFGIDLEQIEEEPASKDDNRTGHFDTSKTEKGKIEFAEMNHELLMSLVESMRDMKSQIQGMANEIARNNQANIDLRSEFTEKFTTMHANIASEVFKIYDPIKRHVTGLSRIVEENASRNAVVEVNVAQMQLNLNDIKKRVDNLETKEKFNSPEIESTRIVPKRKIQIL